MLVIDLDRLKSLNDTHGHLAGADAVRTVGHLIALHLPHEAFACRFGGDEFVVALPGRDIDAALKTADHIRSAVHHIAPVLAGIEFRAGTLSISVGAALFSPDEAITESATNAGEALFRAADQALYAAKAGGRNRVSIASPHLNELPGVHIG